MTDLDLNALAASLADTAAGIDAYIERRAQEIAEPQILAAQLRAKTRMDEQDRETRFEMQRKSDLIAELRRQLNAQIRQVERLGREAKEMQAAFRRIEALKVWVNEDGRQFFFADDVWDAVGDVTVAGAVRARHLRKAADDA